MVPTADRPLALVTGASAGLGREFCVQLAERGYDLILVARDGGRLASFAEELGRKHGGMYSVFTADLATDGGTSTVAERVRVGDINLLINNAGVGSVGSFARVTLSSQEGMLRLHMAAPNALTHAVLPSMIARGSGGIINVSSVASFVATGGNVNYCATKAYLRVFSEALAAEVRSRGIVVQALCPGFTHTEFHSRAAIDKGRIPSVLWMDAPRVVRESLAALAEGDRVVVIPGKRYRAILLLVRYAPRWVRTRLLRRHRRDAPAPISPA